MQRFLEVADVAKRLRPPVVPATIRYHLQRGHIRPSATTMSGGSLFTEADVVRIEEELSKAARLRGRATA